MKDKKKTIVLTGGGSTGHVSVNLALIPLLRDHDYDIHYIGSKNGIERELIEDQAGVAYHPISTGKLRRYFSWENFKDVFRVAWGIIQSIVKICKIKPDIIFSKGGFVSVPVIIGGFFNGVPMITHESDLTPGLANKIAQPFVKEVITTFPDTVNYIRGDKGKFLGPVIREGLKNGDRQRGKKFVGIENDKPNILVMGGSLGARKLNLMVRSILDPLLEDFNVIHSVGKGGLDESIDKKGYYQFEYIDKELNDVFAMSDLVISRAGSNAIFEFLYYKLPMILIPLPTSQSRGDQIDNAKSFEKNGYAVMKMEDQLDEKELLDTIYRVYENRQVYIEKMQEVNFEDTVAELFSKIRYYEK